MSKTFTESKRKLLIILLLLALSAFAVVFFGVLTSGAASTENKNASVLTEAEWEITGMDEGDIPAYGKRMPFPAAIATVDGKQIDANVQIIKPDGIGVGGADVLLDQAGVYTVVFTAESGDKFCRTEQTFTVNAPYVTVGEKSSAEYGTYDGVVAETAVDNVLKLRIAEGETVTFNKPIDLNEVASDEELISLFVSPDEMGAADFDCLILTLTDISDSSATVTITIERVLTLDTWAEGIVYVKAAGNGQTLTGVEGYGTSAEKVHVGGTWGAACSHSFAARTFNSNTSAYVPYYNANQQLKVYFNNTEKNVHVGRTFVTDLNNPAYYQTLWNGFPSGKVLLSLSASGYNAKTANIVVSSAFGMDFSQRRVTDTTKPIITIDSEYTSMPVGAKDMEYPVPKASAQDDFDGICPVQTEVIFAYGTPGALTMQLKDNRFIAKYVGEYAIVYRAVDRFDNVAEKTVRLNVGKNAPSINLTLPEYADNYYYGDTLSILPAIVSGGSGNVAVQTKVLLDGEEIPSADGKVRLNAVGAWSVVYTLTDYIGQVVEKEVTLNVISPDAPVFYETPVLPEVMISGGHYTVPTYFAEDYSSESEIQNVCEVKITDSDGTHILQGGETYEAKEEGNVQFVFVYKGFESPGYTVPVTSVKTAESGYDLLDKAKYFVGDINVKKEESAIAISASKAGDSSWTFANSLLADIFSIELRTTPDSHFSAIRVILTDITDTTNTIFAEFRMRAGKPWLISAGGEVELPAALGSPEGSTFTLHYENGYFRIGKLSVPAAEDFKGFVAGKAWLKVVMKDAESGAGYKVLSIGGQQMNDLTDDWSDPMIVVSGEYGGAFDLQDEYVIAPAFAGDVLAPDLDFTMSVFAPDGEVVTAIDGTVLNKVDPSRSYSIKLSDYGQYRIAYTANEINWYWEGNRAFQYMLTVHGAEQPDIVWEKTPQTSAKAGERYELPNFTVSGYETDSEKLTVGKYVYNPQGKLIKLQHNAIVFSMTGEYTFRIIVMDAFGNTTVAEFTVTVKE